MGKIIETRIDNFAGGIVNDSRNRRVNVARVISNFNAIRNSRKLTPYRSTEQGNSDEQTDRQRNFCIARSTATAYSVYGIGIVDGDSTLAEFRFKAITQGSANDLDDAAWTETANYQQSGVDRQVEYNLFAYYPRMALTYFFNNGNQRGIWKYDPSGSVAMAIEGGAAATFAVSQTVVTQGMVHSLDDVFYVAYMDSNSGGVKILKNNAGTWTSPWTNAINGYFPLSICEYGTFLAIAIAPISGVGNSKVVLWDRVSASWNEIIDWGDGQLTILEVVDGELIGISQKGGSKTSFSIGEGGSTNPTSNTSKILRDRIIFRQYIGSRSVKQFLEIESDVSLIGGGAGTTQLPIAKQIANNRLHFLMLIELNGAVRDGIWSIGRNEAGEWSLINDYTTQSAALTTGSGLLYSFIIVGDFALIAYQGGGAFQVSKTAEGATYTTNSTYETKRFITGGSGVKKNLIGTTVETEFLPTAGQVVLAYRVDQNTAWTTIDTYTTDNGISFSSVAGLPKDYKEIEFQILSTGGAEITALSFQEEITDKRPY